MDKNDMIIIGGGVAGLSTGIYGQLSGFRTTIFEMHTAPGGQCTTWERKGYRFDFCLHWLIGTKSSAFHDIWKETNVINDDVKIVDSDIHTMICDDAWGTFTVYTDLDRWQEYLTNMAPEDEAGIRKMCGHMRAAAMFEPFSVPPDLRNFRDYMMILLTKTKLLLLLNRYARISAKTYFKGLRLKNPRLVYFLDRLFCDHDFSALIVIMMLGWFHRKNAGYLEGGSLALARRMAARYQELGGELRLGKKVKKILVDHDRAVGVELADGEVYRADYIISAADGHSTLFGMLDGKYLTPRLRRAYSSWELYKPFVQVSFGVRDIIRSDAAIISYMKRSFNIGDLEVKSGYSILNQSMKDPTLAPGGKTSMVLRFDSPWDYWERISTADYEKQKKIIREKAVEILETHYPGIRDKIEVIDVATPRTIVRFTGVWKGAYEGFLPTGNMVSKTLKSTIPGLKSFYMVGQWMFPGGGLPPAAQSGKWIIQTIVARKRAY